VSFDCADPVPGSGVASCSSAVTLGQGANQSATGQADDLAGNSSSVTDAGVNVDTTPTVTSMQVVGLSAADAQGHLVISTSGQLSLYAADPPDADGAASGVGATYYVVDQDPTSPDCEATCLTPARRRAPAPTKPMTGRSPWGGRPHGLLLVGKTTPATPRRPIGRW